MALAALVISISAVAVGIYEAVDGHPRRNWPEAAQALLGGNPVLTQTSTVVDHWLVSYDRVGGTSTWKTVDSCPHPVSGTDF